jgi:sugar lactone lactonase YvrE
MRDFRKTRAISRWLGVLVLPLAACGGGPDGLEAGDAGTVPIGAGDTGGAGGAGDQISGGGGSAGQGAGAGSGAGACAASAGQSGSVAAFPDDVVFAPNVTVTTLVGGAVAGSADGPAAMAQLSNPVSVIIEPGGGALVVCDFDNDLLRRVDISGATTTVSTMTRQANFVRPYGMAFGADGALYVDTDYNPAGVKNRQSGTVWRVDVSSGVATVVAADLGRPRGLAMLPDGRLVLGDYQNGRVRLLDPQLGTVMDVVGPSGCVIGPDGSITGPPLAVPYGVVALPDGQIVVADEGNHRLHAVTLAGMISPHAGSGDDGTADGPRLASRFAHPTALAVDAAGNVFVSDYVAHRIRRIDPSGSVTTVAGDGTAGFKDGSGAEAQFWGQEGIAVTADGTTLFVADGTGGQEGVPGHRVRKITIRP